MEEYYAIFEQSNKKCTIISVFRVIVILIKLYTENVVYLLSKKLFL